MVIAGITGIIMGTPEWSRRCCGTLKWCRGEEGSLRTVSDKLEVVAVTIQTAQLLSANHQNVVDAKDLPYIFGILMGSLQWVSLDLSMIIPGSGCVVPRFEGTLLIQTLGFVGAITLFLAAWGVAKSRGRGDRDQKTWIILRRLVDFIKKDTKSSKK